MAQTQTNFKDEGYTSPDFMTNLFKKPLYSPLTLTSLNSTHSLPEDLLSPSHKENHGNSPLSPLASLNNLHTDLKFRQNPKIFRSHSFIDDEKIHSRKYKIFFKTFLHGQIPEDQLNSLWDQLENSLSNPYQFDKLIESTKARRQIQKENNKQITKQHAKCKPDKPEKNYSKSIQKKHTPLSTNNKYKSLQKLVSNKTSNTNLLNFREKCIRLSGDQKALIAKNMSQIRVIVNQNERLIRQK